MSEPTALSIKPERDTRWSRRDLMFMTHTNSGIFTTVTEDGTLHVSMGPGDVSVRLRRP